jgi:sterol desaturase/sphingolipid hydroxylase (fatty acid hydroxylase superfamily)
MDTLIDALLAFAILTAVFLPLERLFPAHGQPVFRKEWGTDLCFFLGQYLVWTAPVVAVLAAVHAWIAALPLDGVWGALRAQPLWLQFAVAIPLSDLAIYWGHRLSHSNRFLWRFHRVHHTAERLDWLAAHREHPLDNLYTRLIENLPPILLGFPLPALAGFAMFRGLWALYIHSNVRLTPGPLRYLLGAPRLHHWHHEAAVGGRVNFANLSPLMDLAFGTYHDPGRMPERYGIDERIPHGYLAQMVEPFRARAGRSQSNSVVQWAPSQKGLFLEAPQRQSVKCESAAPSLGRSPTSTQPPVTT